MKRKYQQLCKLLKLYQKFDIVLLNRNKGRIVVLENATAKDFSMDLFKKLWGKHIQKKEEVLLIPRGNYQVAFVDDPKDPKWREKITKDTIIIETSPNKYQLHIPLEADFTYTKRALQKAFNRFFKGDNVSWNHARKLPFYLNNKYDPPYYINIEKNTSKRTIIELLNEIQPIWEEIKAEEEPVTTPHRQKDEVARTQKWKSWIDFFEGDNSQADYRYAIYLFSRGYSWEEVKEILLQESPDIHIRKKGHLQDYLNRTLQKAYNWHKRTYKPF